MAATSPYFDSGTQSTANDLCKQTSVPFEARGFRVLNCFWYTTRLFCGSGIIMLISNPIAALAVFLEHVARQIGLAREKKNRPQNPFFGLMRRTVLLVSCSTPDSLEKMWEAAFPNLHANYLLHAGKTVRKPPRKRMERYPDKHIPGIKYVILRV